LLSLASGNPGFLIHAYVLLSAYAAYATYGHGHYTVLIVDKKYDQGGTWIIFPSLIIN